MRTPRSSSPGWSAPLAAAIAAIGVFALACSEPGAIDPPPPPDPPDTTVVANPVVSAGPDLAAVAGDTVQLTFSFTAADPATWSYTVDWGDAKTDVGTGTPGAARTLSHAYAASGSYRAVVTVSEPGGARGSDDVTVAVSAPPQAEVFIGAGDIATCPGTDDERTADLIAAIPGTVFTLGDNVYPDGTDKEFADCYHPSWGRFKDRTRPTVGNHEYQTTGASGYFNYFGAAAGERGKGWYSYNLGSWHIIVLNSNFDFIDDAAQEAWLRADLAANPAKCTLAMTHHPRFGSGIPNGGTAGDLRLKPLFDILHGAGVEVLLSGHDHGYERMRPQAPDASAAVRGVRQFVVGSGGADVYGVGPGITGSQALYRNFGVLKLLLDRDSYTWQFIPLPGSTYTDTGTTICY